MVTICNTSCSNLILNANNDYTQVRKHAQIMPHIQKTHTHKETHTSHAHSQTCLYALKRGDICARVYDRTQSHKHAHTHTNTNTRTSTHTHTHTSPHTQTHTHEHTQMMRFIRIRGNVHTRTQHYDYKSHDECVLKLSCADVLCSVFTARLLRLAPLLDEKRTEKKRSFITHDCS